MSAAARSDGVSASVVAVESRRAALRDAIDTVSAALSVGALTNTEYATGANASASVVAVGAAVVATPAVATTAAYIPAASRAEALTARTARARALLDEFEALELPHEVTPTTTNNKATTTTATATQLTAARAWNSQRQFAELCGLSVKLLSDTTKSSNGASSSTSTSATVVVTPAIQGHFMQFGAAAAVVVPTPPVFGVEDVQQRRAAVKPLASLQAAYDELRKCRGFAYQTELQQQQGGGSGSARKGGATASTAAAVKGKSSSSSSSSPMAIAANTTAHRTKTHTSLLVERVTEALAAFCADWSMDPAAVRLPASLLDRNTTNTNTNTNSRVTATTAMTRMPSLVSPPHCAALFTAIAALQQPLLRLLSEVLTAPSLDAVTESTCERLHRAAFDVEELSHEQSQAVTDGDMARSEELYFEQTDLLESMKAMFDKLESSMEGYRASQVDRPREKLLEIQRTFASEHARTLSHEEGERAKVRADIAAVQSHQSQLAAAAAQHRGGVSLYTTEWGRLYDGNAQQQQECLAAMAALEARLSELAAEQQFLIRDRVARVSQESARRGVAASLAYYLDAHGSCLVRTERELTVLLEGLKQVGSAVEYGFCRADMHLRDVLLSNVDAALLASRKERLEQFRSLYLTLGDLKFKKTRHAEEIAKKVEYYTIQQEIAMDALNPKAREFSQARQRWAIVQEEINGQLNTIDTRTQRQVADFAPTEQLLIAAGVTFTHPSEELRQRNSARQAKLSEYKQLMDSNVAANRRRGGGTGVDVSGDGDGGVVGVNGHQKHHKSGSQAAAEEILAEDLRAFARAAPRLRSTEEATPSTSAANPNSNSSLAVGNNNGINTAAAAAAAVKSSSPSRGGGLQSSEERVQSKRSPLTAAATGRPSSSAFWSRKSNSSK